MHRTVFFVLFRIYWMRVSSVYVRKISMIFQSALVELWVFEVPHIIRNKGWNTQHRFCLFLSYCRYENWVSVSFLDVRWGNDEFSICVRWALKNLKFITSSGTKGGIHSTLVCSQIQNICELGECPFFNFRLGADEVSVFFCWFLRRLSFLTSSGTRGGMQSIFCVVVFFRILKMWELDECLMF